MNRNKPVVLFFPFNLLSHYSRCLQLAVAVRGKYRILFMHSPLYASMVRQQGFETFTGETFDAPQVMACARHFDFSWLNQKDIERVFLSQVRCIEEFNPLFVVGDVASTLKMAAEKTATGYVALMNGYMTKYYALPRKISMMHPAFRYRDKMPARIFDFITVKAEAHAFRQIHHPFRKLRKKYALQKKKHYLDELEGDHNLIADLPEIFPQHPLPLNYKTIGPLFYSSLQEEDDVLRFISNGKPTILASMGCTGNWNRLKFLTGTLFKEYNIIAAGDHRGVLKGDNICSKPFMNNCAVLEKVDLMICHGGNGSIYQALSHGVPLLCVPEIFEQEWNIHQIQAKNLGILLTGNEPTHCIAQAVAYWSRQKNSPPFSALRSRICISETQAAFKAALEKWYPSPAG